MSGTTLLGSNCDIIYLSYNEPNAEKNFLLLKNKYPRVKRLHGVVGVGAAYKTTAFVAQTDFYFIVDADSFLKEEFDLDQVKLPYQKNCIYIWLAENAVNGLAYGYGGIKLCSKEAIFRLKDDDLDVITTGENKLLFQNVIASVTEFNTSEYDAWKAGFRECCMLRIASGLEMNRDSVDKKIAAWTTMGADKPYGEWTIKGAKAGIRFAEFHRDDKLALKQINDPNWLYSMFLSDR